MSDNKKSIICDIDGVVCDCSARIAKYSDYKALERGDYNAFRVSMRAYNTASVDEDIPIEHGINLLKGLLEFHEPEHFTFLTSRGSESRANTLGWLREHVFSWLSDDNLIMRPEYFESEPGVFWRDGEPKFCHVEFKRGETFKIAREFNVVMALDDHLPICEMYQELGVPSLHVKFPGVDCLSKAGMTVPVLVGDKHI
jgi:hypothetical protein